MNAPLFIHIPTPGDHYSPATGSATMTVIHELSRCHAAEGRNSRVIVNGGTRHDYSVGECVEVEGPTYPPNWKKGMDGILARVGMGRPLSAAIYRPHIVAIPEDFDGPVMIHNGPSAIRLARKLRPRAMLCLWAHNELFRTYDDHETRAVVEATDRVLCCSRFIADSLAARLPRELAGRVRVVHNGVDIQRFHPVQLPMHSPPLLVFVGRVDPVKGPDLLVRAAVKLAERGVQFGLRVVGSQNFSAGDPLTPYEKQLRDLARPIAERVQFVPFTDRAGIPAIYCSADIHVAPAKWDEPFGLTVLEGMASGLPTVTTARGGIPEVAGDAAIFFAPPDVDELSERLEELLIDPVRRAEWGRRARKRAEGMTWEHSYQQLKAAIAPRSVDIESEKPNTFIHVPTPGDHYSLATGSATISVLHELTRKHLEAGGNVRVIVGKGTQHELRDGECVEVDFSEPRTLYRRTADTALGWSGLEREYECRRYLPAFNGIEPNFDGTIFLYNAAPVIGQFKAKLPRAQVCLYAVNALFRSYSRREVRRIVDHADAVICCSRYIAQDLIGHLGRPSEKVKVVHNGVDTTRFIPRSASEIQRSASGPQEPMKILFIGRATPQKGPDLLLRAAALLRGKVPPFKVRIVGSRGFAPTKDLSPYERTLRELAESIRDIVEFQPSISRDRLLSEYHAATIFCAPSNWDDPFPLTVLEAMSCGLPVVASRRGGIPEGGAESILYFRPPDVDELAEQLGRFLRNPAERDSYGTLGRRRALLFDWKNQYRILRQALADTAN